MSWHLLYRIFFNSFYCLCCVQKQFTVFVVGLRKTYKEKVQTFRHVIDVHQVELSQKQQYWDNALKVGTSLFSRSLGLPVRLVIFLLHVALFIPSSDLNQCDHIQSKCSKSFTGPRQGLETLETISTTSSLTLGKPACKSNSCTHCVVNCESGG